MSRLVSFAELIEPLSVDDFFLNYWEKNFFHLRRKKADYYDAVLSIDDLDEHLLSQQLTPSFFKVTKCGDQIPLDQWTRVKSFNNDESIRVVDPTKLFSLYGEGVTFVINEAHKSIPKLMGFCAHLEQQFKFRVQTNIYMTPSNSQGFIPHFDTHDVIVLQVSGSKAWRLYGKADQPLPIEKQDTQNKYSNRGVEHTIELGAGDLLYLPRGFIHDAVSNDSPSLHITLGLLPQYSYRLLEEIVNIAKKDCHFREAMPHGFSSLIDKAAYIARFKEQLAELINTIDIAAILKNQDTDFIKNQLHYHRGQFTSLVQIPKLTMNSVLSKRPNLSYVIKEESQLVTVCFVGHEVSLPQYLRSALDTVLQERPFTIAEIQGLLSQQGKIDFVSKFLQSGFLVINHV